MTSSQATCLLCLSTNKKTINFYSDRGRELNIISILSTHFWFQLDDIKALSQNICCECWQKTESFHEFYQAIRTAHKEFETVFVKIENEDADVEDDGEIYQPVELPPDNYLTKFVKLENDEGAEDNESSDESVCEIPHTNSIETRAFDALPKATQEKYKRTYDKFMAWKTGENIDKDCFSEAVVLEYFYYLQSKYKPSTLCVEYSMLRIVIQRNDNVDICYPEVTSLLKKSSAGYIPQKSNVFQPDDIRRFFSEARDTEFLAVKVITIFLINGSNSDSLQRVEVNDVSEEGSVFVIKIRNAKKTVIRSFTVENQYASYVQKYRDLRPANVAHDRFFLNYQKGKCTVQPIGKNKFNSAPKSIAKFLKLEDAANYTGYSFRKEPIPNKKKAGGSHSEQINCEKSTEAMASSASTSSAAIGEDAEVITFDVLPEKSMAKYLLSYERFMAWRRDSDIDKDDFSAAVMLEYFHYMKRAVQYKPTTLWTEYSKLRTTIQNKHSVDINCKELTTYLRTSSFGYRPQRLSVFELDEMRRFLYEADDNEFLAVKVIMIFGMFGMSSVDALTKLDVTDVTEQGSVFLVKFPDRKLGSRSFIVENDYAAYVQKYKDLRPGNVPHNRFFINLKNGECTIHPIGKNKFCNAPKLIANFLNLKDSLMYSCISFRQKALKRSRNRGIRSLTGLDSYIEECLPKKSKTDDLEISTDAMDTSAISENKISEDVKAWESLPQKSREKYVRSYDKFLVWKTNEKLDRDCFSGKVMLQYFNHLQTKYKPTSLCVEYSMLRATIKKNDNVDINYPELSSLLKKSSVGFRPQKSNLFRPDELRRFLTEADDFKFLAVKVMLIFGLYSGARVEELTMVEVQDVSEQGSVFDIKVPDLSKNGIRSFTVDSECAVYIKKYKKLRPKIIPHRRFFLNYQNGKCTVQPIGKNKIANVPKTVANFLNLDDADNYTNKSYRGASKVLLADGGTEESTANDTKMDDQILEQNHLKSSATQNRSTITSAMDTSTEAFANTFQAYNVQPHYIQPHQLLPSTVENALTIPSTGEIYHLQPHQVHHTPYQFNNCHNL